jgi:hypothetical protein
MPDTSDLRRFRVHARHVDHHESQLVLEHSFEAAAMAYAENFADDGATDMRVFVRDMATGHEHCFRIDLAAGVAAGCA